MSYLMRAWIVQKRHEKRITKIMDFHMKLIFISTGLISILLLGLGVYGKAYLWCWISEDYNDYRLGFFYSILFLAWIVIAYMLWDVNKALHVLHTRSNLSTKISELFDTNLLVKKRLFAYVSIFFFVWFFSVLNRLLEMGLGRVVYVTSLLQVIFLPLQGFFNAIAFGAFRDITIRNSNRSTSSSNSDMKEDHKNKRTFSQFIRRKSFVLNQPNNSKRTLTEVNIESPDSDTYRLKSIRVSDIIYYIY